MKIQTLPISTIQPYQNNPRKNDDAVEGVMRSIEEYGFQQPLVVDANNEVVVGHTRLKAAKALGLSEVPCVVAKDLTDEQVKAYRIMDNKSAEVSEWDYGLLKEEIEALTDFGFDLDLTGLDEIDLQNIVDLDAGDVQGLTDEDDVPDVPETPKTVEGDIWVLGNHRLMCGDSTSIDAVDKLMDGVKANAVVTDPPYGIGIDGQKKSVSKNPKHNRKHHEKKGWDEQRPDASIFNYIVALNVPAVIWGGNYFADLLPASRGWIYWSKGQDGLTMSDGELAWTTENKPLRSQTVNRNALRDSVHPTQKPVQVIDFSCDYLQVPQKGAVLDLFAGSGTLCIVCEQRDARAFLIERDEAYCDVIIKRWQDYTGQDAVNEATGKRFSDLQNGTENG